MPIELKRVYDPPAQSDGRRVLVDRVWPRGIARDELDIDAWLKDLAPSTELRKWFAHDADEMAGVQAALFRRAGGARRGDRELGGTGARRPGDPGLRRERPRAQ